MMTSVVVVTAKNVGCDLSKQLEVQKHYEVSSNEFLETCSHTNNGLMDPRCFIIDCFPTCRSE